METRAKNKETVSRRTFVTWSAAASGLALSSGLVACQQPQSGTGTSGSALEPEGEWKNGMCWFGCGGNCINQVYVQDGAALYQRTDEVGDDSFDRCQQRGCARGRSLRGMVFGADRLKYPMKRKNWEPGGGDKSLRGRDEWVRISWEEALDLTATEMQRIIETHGNASILSAEYQGPGRLINAIGGSATMWCAWSSGGFYWTSQKMIGGGWPRHSLSLSDRYDYFESELIVLWGHNPTWSSQGMPILCYLEAKRRGAKIIVVDPIYHDSAKVLADEFVPCRPGTDAALLIALAHEMITQNLQDQDFLDKYTVGFDAEHMPEGADPKENFKDYVLGTYDGQPKTAEWASEICGTPVETITSLAVQMATAKPMALTAARAAARFTSGDQTAQAFFTVGWMTGNVGKKGAMVGHVSSGNVGSGSNGPWLINPGAPAMDPIPNPISPYHYYNFDPFDESEFTCINLSETWEATLKKEYHAAIKGVLPCNIQMMNHIGRGATLNQAPASKLGIEAHREVEFVVATGYHLHTHAKYADIVMPACTKWEEEGETLSTKANRETVLSAQQITAPLFEAKTDFEIDRELASRMGVDPDEVVPYSQKQHGFETIKGATMTLEDGVTVGPLFTITQEDIDGLGVTGEPQEGQIPYKEFVETGFARVNRSENDNYGYTALKDFIDDPVANPRDTPSGKFEIHCQSLVDFIDAVGFTTNPPVAQYHPTEEGYEQTFSNWETKEKGAYPFQLISLHCLRTAHSTFDNVPYIREAFPNDLRINKRDAEALGIKQGDTVLITSKWGQSLRNAEVTERIMPGVVKVDQVSWVDVNEDDGIDQAGSANYLIGPLKSGSGIQAWNTAIVNLKKWDGEPLEPDYLWPQRIVEV